MLNFVTDFKENIYLWFICSTTLEVIILKADIVYLRTNDRRLPSDSLERAEEEPCSLY